MWVPRPKRALLGAGLFLVSCLLMLSVLLQAGLAAPLRQGSPTVVATFTTATAVPTPLAVPSTPVPTLEAVSYPQMLAVYKEVLETTKWVGAAFLGILTLSGLGALWLFQHGLKGIGEVQAKANELNSQLESSREQSKNLGNKWRKLSEEAESLRKGVEVIKEQASSAQQKLRDIEQTAPRLETLATIDTYAVRLLCSDKQISRVAKRTLIELSKDDDPVVRRECVRVFGTMPDYPECFVDLQDPLIISRLQELVLKDPERGVQLEAKLTLKKLGVDLENE